MDDDYSESMLRDLPLWGDEDAQAVLHAMCEKHNVPLEVITELVIVQRERQHQEKARGINPRIEEILGSIE